jgi:ribosomal protein S18 acetylase RimI-like enzyme
MQYSITKLSPQHELADFETTSPKLTDYLKKTAGQHMRKSISQVYVATDDDNPHKVLGYCSITPRAPVPTSELPLEFQRRLPHNVPAYTLGRLAVATHSQRQGIGELLLLHAMALIRQAAASVGGWGMFVDAEDEKAAIYYRQFGFTPLPSNPLILFMPVSDLPG